MYIVAIAWLYVVVLMAATETSIIAGVMTLVFYGLVPLSIVLFIFGTPERRRRAARREAAEEASADQDPSRSEPITQAPAPLADLAHAVQPSRLADQPVRRENGADPGQDQRDLPDRR